MTRKCYYDCEFLEDGKTIELISIGMVDDTGREFYAISDEVGFGALHDRILEDRWLMQNVVPHLPLSGRKGHAYAPPGTNVGVSFFNLDLDSNLVMPRRMIRNGVREFLLGDWRPTPIAEDPPDIELWAWYGAYDHVALAQLWGRMIGLPKGIPRWTNDLRQEVHRLGNPRLPRQAAGEHNALEDARWLRDAAAWLAERAPGYAELSTVIGGENSKIEPVGPAT